MCHIPFAKFAASDYINSYYLNLSRIKIIDNKLYNIEIDRFYSGISINFHNKEFNKDIIEYLNKIRNYELAVNADIDDDNPFNNLADYVKEMKNDLYNLNDLEYEFVVRLRKKYKYYGDIPLKSYECLIRPIVHLIILDNIKYAISECIPEMKDVLKSVLFKILDEVNKNKDYVLIRSTNLHNGFQTDPKINEMIDNYFNIYKPESDVLLAYFYFLAHGKFDYISDNKDDITDYNMCDVDKHNFKIKLIEDFVEENYNYYKKNHRFDQEQGGSVRKIRDAQVKQFETLYNKGVEFLAGFDYDIRGPILIEDRYEYYKLDDEDDIDKEYILDSDKSLNSRNYDKILKFNKRDKNLIIFDKKDYEKFNSEKDKLLNDHLHHYLKELFEIYDSDFNSFMTVEQTNGFLTDHFSYLDYKLDDIIDHILKTWEYNCELRIDIISETIVHCYCKQDGSKYLIEELVNTQSVPKIHDLDKINNLKMIEEIEGFEDLFRLIFSFDRKIINECNADENLENYESDVM